MFGSPLKKARVRREPSRMATPPVTPTKTQKFTSEPSLLTPSQTPMKQERLFDTGRDNNGSPEAASAELSDPMTPTKPRKRNAAKVEADDIFFQGKALFQRGSRVREVIGRDEERQNITEKIQTCTKSHTSGALYVSGLPGTGKSALVSEILSTIDLGATTKVAIINCMTIDKPEQTYALIAKEFGYLDRRSQKDKQRAADLLHKELQNKRMSHVLVMDELDRIVTADQEVLFRIFEWACGSSTNLLVIGIANAIDLTDRFLPRLQAHKLKPEVVAFKPYTAKGITDIIEARLRQLPRALMHPAAVRICAAKTAANSGDLRKAFDVCRRAIETVEEQGGDVVTTPLIAKVCQAAFGGIDAKQRLAVLNFQQKAVLCVLIKTERQAAQPNITVTQAFQEYEHRCGHNAAINSLSYPEYMEVVNALDSAGLVAITGLCGKKGLGTLGNARVSRGGGGAAGSKGSEGYRDEFGLRRISSRAQVMDVLSNLADNDPLRSILMT